LKIEIESIDEYEEMGAQTIQNDEVLYVDVKV
jgi:hypothetical protein